MAAFRYYRIWYFVVDKTGYIIQLDKTICISLKTVRCVQLSIAERFFYTNVMKFLN